MIKYFFRDVGKKVKVGKMYLCKKLMSGQKPSFHVIPRTKDAQYKDDKQKFCHDVQICDLTIQRWIV